MIERFDVSGVVASPRMTSTEPEGGNAPVPRPADPFSDLGATPVTELIATAMPTLSPSLRRVAQTVLDDPLAVARLSADQLARQAQVSQASVTRFCQAIGLPSYQSLLLRIAQQSGQFKGAGWETTDIDVDIAPEDSLETVTRILVEADIRGLQHAGQAMDLRAVDRAAKLMRKAHRLDIYGTGASGLIAQELELLLFRIGLPVRAWTEVHAAHTSAALLTGRDVAVAISDSGKTRETYEALEQAKERGARTIAITRDPRSPIGRLADVQLTAFGGDTGIRTKSFASRFAQLLLVDVLYVRLAQLDYEKASAGIALTSHIAGEHSTSRPRKGK